jgi:hypothetical protein
MSILMYIEVKMKTTATEFRTHLFTWLDKVIATGDFLEIERKGVKLSISRQDRGPKLLRLPKRPTIVGDPASLLGLDWSSEWKPS